MLERLKEEDMKPTHVTLVRRCDLPLNHPRFEKHNDGKIVYTDHWSAESARKEIEREPELNLELWARVNLSETTKQYTLEELEKIAETAYRKDVEIGERETISKFLELIKMSGV